MSNAPSTPSIVGAEGWHTTMPPTTSQAATQGAFEVAQRSRLPQGAACGQPPLQREGGSVWQIFTLEQLKATLGISPRYTAHHRSVGRLSAQGYKIMPLLSWLRVIAPLQHRQDPKSSYASKGICPIYRYTNNLNYSYGCYLCWNTPVDSLQSRLGSWRRLFLPPSLKTA